MRFSADGNALGNWQYGSLNWNSDTHSVYTPFVVQPALFAETADVFGSGSKLTQKCLCDLPVGRNDRVATLGVHYVQRDLLAEQNVAQGLCKLVDQNLAS